MNIGDRACLLRQRHERGIVASGWFTSEIYEADHWDGSGRTTTYADIRFDAVLPVADRLPVEVLKSEVPAIMWDRLQGSGVAVAPPNDTHLDQLWATHLTATPYLFPEERFTNGLPKGRPN